jgi:CheY-like chemotaxis protein
LAEASRRILIVEDEAMVAMVLEDMVLDMGHHVVGPAARLETAVGLARSEMIDFAILDVNLGEFRSFPVADVLSARGIPFIFATGYGRSGLVDPYKNATVLGKPYDLAAMQVAVVAGLAGS